MKPQTMLTPAWPLTVRIWQWYLGNFRDVLKVSLWWLASLPFMLPASVMTLAGISPTGDVLTQEPEHFKVFLFFVVLGVIASILVAVIVRPALVTTIYAHTKRKTMKPAKAFLHAKEVIWPYVIVMILLGAAVSLGFLAFFVPGIIFAIYLIFAEQAVVLEGKHPVDALKRSFELVKGHFWSVLWRFLFVNAVFYLGTAFVTTLVIKAPLALLSNAASAGPITTKFIATPFLILGAVISAITLPLFLAVQVTLFKELQEMKK